MDQATLDAVYNIEWQAVRIQCKGNWRTIEGVKQNLGRLWQYLSEHPVNARQRRVTNLAAMVRRSYPSMPPENGVIELLSDFQSRVSMLTFMEGEDIVVDSARTWNKLPQDIRRKIIDDLRIRLSHTELGPKKALQRFLLEIEQYGGKY